jgi:acetoin utilization deacetylase AcuC-like enzyme
VQAIAVEHCGGRIVSLLEGGYDLGGLAASVEAHLLTLLGERPAGTAGPDRRAAPERARE